MRVDVGEVEINYVTEGEGPAVVLTHGLGGDIGSWETTAAALRDRYTVLRWDVRGFGQSDKPLHALGPKFWAADLDALLDKLGIAQAVVAGISMGGVVSQRFAIDFPQRTQALILLSTSSEVGPKARAQWEERAANVDREGMAASQGATLSFSEEYERQHALEVADAFDDVRQRNDPQAYAAACRAVGDYNFTPELSSIRCPTLVLQGLQDRLTPPGGSVIISRNIPDARLEMIDHCGHAIPTEQFDEMLHLIEDFLGALA